MGKTKSYKEHLLKKLQDPQEAATYLHACLKDEDPNVFLLALKDTTEARNGMSSSRGIPPLNYLDTSL